MKAGEIQQELWRSNLWWRRAEDWTKDDFNLTRVTDAPFTYRSGVLENLVAGGLYVLRGPRRVGKSVEVKQAIDKLIRDGVNPKAVTHVSVEGWHKGDLVELVDIARQMNPLDGRRYWFIDEVTAIEGGWPYRIKWLRDQDIGFRNDTVVLTGSSSTDLRESMGILAGRHGNAVDPYRVLLPMGFRSFCLQIGAGRDMPEEIGPMEIPDLHRRGVSGAALELVPWLNILIQAWETYLLVGGFPEAVTSYLGTVTPLAEELLRVVSNDAFRTARISDLKTRALLRRLRKALGSTVNVSNLARDIGVSPPTMNQRLTDLREAFTVWPASRENRGHAQLRAQQKIYFTDPVYTRMTDDEWLDLTILSEQQLGMVLLRNLERRFPGSYVGFERVLYHRTGAGTEIDFVGPDFGGVAIESKYVDDYGWRKAIQTLKASPWKGIVATRGLIDLKDPDVAAVPAAFLAWLLDT